MEEAAGESRVVKLAPSRKGHIFRLQIEQWPCVWPESAGIEMITAGVLTLVQRLWEFVNLPIAPLRRDTNGPSSLELSWHAGICCFAGSMVLGNRDADDSQKSIAASIVRIEQCAERDRRPRPCPVISSIGPQIGKKERNYNMSEILSSTFVLAVKDLAASKKFYLEKLGFAEDFSVEDGHS